MDSVEIRTPSAWHSCSTGSLGWRENALPACSHHSLLLLMLLLLLKLLCLENTFIAGNSKTQKVLVHFVVFV